MKKRGNPGGAGLLTARRLRCVRRTVLAFLASLPPAMAGAADPGTLPTGGAVAAGSASITQAGSRLDVQQQSSRAIVNWNTFNIGSQASVNFQQPGASSVVLNRVASGGGVSQIYGSLTANGQVFLVNPAGTVFGRGAQVNVGGLVASSLDITNENFLSGNYRFASGGTAGSIVNQATLTAAAGGYIALLAPQVINEGVIAAQMGTVAIGAGNAVTIDLSGTGLVSMQVDQGAVDALIANRSLVQADGGVVLMSARAAGQLAGGVINNSGEIHAARVTERDGVIRLEAGDTVINSGLISARGSEGRGGEIRLLGDKVGLFGAGTLEASGEAGGGTVLVGGNYQGKGPERNASRTVIDRGATIRASATGNGDGGKVVVWADDVTKFSGSIEAKGGPQGGNGGFVETSGKNVLQAFGTVDASAPKGSGGTWLLDPNNITISAAGSSNVNGTFDSTDDNAVVNNTALGAALTNGTNVSVTTQSAGSNTQVGDISVQAPVTASLAGGQTATLNLVAQRNIDFTAAGSLSSGAGILNVNLNAGTDVGATNTPGMNASAISMAPGSSIVTGGGNVTATANTNGITLAGINTGVGSLTVNSNFGAISQVSALTVGGVSTFNAFANTITLTNGANDFVGSVSAIGQNISIADVNALALSGVAAMGSLSTSSGGPTTLGTLNVGSANIQANGGSGSIAINGPLNAGAGAVTLIAGGAISESGAGLISTTDTLATTSVGGQTLNGANTIGNFSATNSGSGAISLTNTGTLLKIFGLFQSAPSGSVSVSNTGALEANSFISTSAGNVSLTAINGNLTVGGSGINSSNGAIALSATGASSDILVNNGIAAGSGPITINAGRDFTQSAGFTATSGSMDVTAGRDILITASGSSASLNATSMSLTAGNELKIQGGTGTNAFAFASASAGQTVNANTVTLLGGSGASGNSASLFSSGAQTINAAGILLQGGPSGGVANASFNGGNYAQIQSVGNQTVTVGSAGLTLIGGGGGATNTDNWARVFHSGLVGTQTINVNGGGSIVLTGGSSGLSGVGGAGHGSRATIQTDGISQHVNFTAGGAINLTGGTVGSRSFALITAENGSQTITGSPSITLTGGASGGIDDEGNFARLFGKTGQTISASSIVLTGGSGGVENNAGISSSSLQSINAGAIAMNAGAGGTENSAFIQAPTQNIAVLGDLTLTGGGSVPSATNGSGAGIGGLGAPNATATNLILTVGGNLTMTGGSNASSGVRIGSGFIGGQPTDMAITVGGNVILNPGTASGAGFGTPGSNPAGGNISITAGGTIALNDSTTVGSLIRTLGNVTLRGASISEGTNGKSLIAANALTTTSTAGATALAALAVGSLNATASGPLSLGQGTISGILVANSNGNPITQAGGLTVGGTAGITAGAAPITLTAANDFQGVVTLSNSGANTVQITDTNTISFSNMLLGSGFTVNAPTIFARDTTTTGNQLWGGNVTFNSTETTNGGNFVVTGTTTLGDAAAVNTGSGNVSFGGSVFGTTALVLSIGSTGTVSILGTGSMGSLTFPVVFTLTPAGLVLAQPISFAFSSPGVPGSLNFATGSSVSAFIGGSATATVLSGGSGSLSQSATAQSAQTAAVLTPETSVSSTVSATSLALMAFAAAGGSVAPVNAAATSDSGTTRLTASSGVSKETIRQIDQMIAQARTQLFLSALTQLAKDPAVADVPECGTTGQAVCVKPGKQKKSATLAGAEADPVIKRRVALLFGNDRYLAPIPALETPIHDVEEIGKVLQDRLGYEARIVRNATREDIVNELNRLVTEVDEDDSVFVYFAGHGYQSEKGGSGYWIPVDGSNTDAATWISNAAISKFLSNMASRQVMLVSDSCYSGTLAQEQKVQSSDATVFDRKEILRKRSVLVMSSGGNEPVADGGHDNHSLFAYHLLRSLNQVDGDMVGGDIHERVRTAIVKEYPQDPQYGAVVSAGHAQGGEYLIEKK